ncbi:uncharacterized protein LOC116344419 [Contarinia nasturtii]|uniref:uncharacterized protein LOC116344419 n=1 Tax=Contarinia nasturtii TaxID=265458 RepID=UPI0012D456CA|nr:uncharacterized protein LOC116344419 [Contarinia nasturtii]
MSLPPLIVSKKGSRRKTLDRCVKKLIDRGLVNQANLPKESKPERLASPKMYYWKNWPLNSVNALQMGDDAANTNDHQQQQQQQPEQEHKYRELRSRHCCGKVHNVQSSMFHFRFNIDKFVCETTTTSKTTVS